LTSSEKTEKMLRFVYLFWILDREKSGGKYSRDGKVSNKRLRMSVFEGRERPLGSCLPIGTTVMAENHRYDYTQQSYPSLQPLFSFQEGGDRIMKKRIY
jgi:hypothetical protein